MITASNLYLFEVVGFALLLFAMFPEDASMIALDIEIDARLLLLNVILNYTRWTLYRRLKREFKLTGLNIDFPPFELGWVTRQDVWDANAED